VTIRETPYGRVDTLFEGTELEAVWASKQAEEIDPDWFNYEHDDVLLVVQGCLKVEFRDRPELERVLQPGDCLILSAGTQCRAYRWPRDEEQATIFVAVSPPT
jgi:mannose-6-phosphate isomerase-like protein (cupin superfamily)